MNFFLLAIICGLPTIQSEAVEAWRDVEKLPALDAKNARYLTAYTIPSEGSQRREARTVSAAWVNSLSMRRRMARPKDIAGSVMRVDLRDYGWSADAWEKLVAQDRYVNEYSVDADALNALRYYTGSNTPLVRLDWFLTKTCLEPDYSRFLGLPGTLKELQTFLGVQEGDVKKLSLNVGGARLESIVAPHNRQLERYPTITGYFWLTRDTKTNIGKQAVLDNLFGVQSDAGEFLFSLPNGLQGGYLADGQGKQQVAAPPDIAIDTQTAFHDKQVLNYRSCIGCHEQGIREFQDVVSSLVKGRKLAIDTYSKEKQIALEEFYLSPLGQQITADQVKFTLALNQACGLTPQEFSRGFLKLVYDYQERKVDDVRAARELGINVDELPAVLNQAAKVYPEQSLSLLAIPAGHPIAVDQWEQLFGFASAAVRQKGVK